MSNVSIVKTFYDPFSGVSGGASYFVGSVADRIGESIVISIAWNITEARLQFISSSKTIKLLNPYDSRRWSLQGFKVGDTITVVDSVSNDGNYTIVSISDDDLSIVVAQALTNEKDRSASVHGVTLITSLDYLYNLIGQNTPETYVSLVDPTNIQVFSEWSRYSCSDSDQVENRLEVSIMGS
jgi:hypothetical protein